jgi:hypothetical protein
MVQFKGIKGEFAGPVVRQPQFGKNLSLLICRGHYEITLPLDVGLGTWLSFCLEGPCGMIHNLNCGQYLRDLDLANLLLSTPSTTSISRTLRNPCVAIF